MIRKIIKENIVGKLSRICLKFIQNNFLLHLKHKEYISKFGHISLPNEYTSVLYAHV